MAETTETASTEVEKPSRSIRKTIIEKIKSSSDAVKASTIQALVDEEIVRRKEFIIKGLAKLDELDKEMKKHKPDNISYDENGKVLSESWTKSALDNRKKTQESIKKVEDAIDKALLDNNYDGLKNLQ